VTIRDRRHPLRWLPTLLVVLLVGACGAGGPSPTPGGTPGPTPGAFTAGELRLVLIGALGPRWYCDQDEYPVGRDERQSAIENWPQVVAEGEIFRAVAERLGLDPDAAFDDDEKLAVWRLWKVAASIPFEAVPSGDGYRFDYLARPVGAATDGVQTIGIIDATGAITVESRTAAGEPMCPICLVRGTTIDTPDGSVAVERLTVGDPIWTLDADGRRVLGTVVAIGSTGTPASHRVVRLALADGRSMTASPGHPLADGRALGSLAVGDRVDGSAVVSLTWLPYDGGRTFDLVVSGATGVYLVDGIPTASTIRPAAVVPAG
jgi:hypothetical protein